MATATTERGALTHPDIEKLGEVNKDILKILGRPGKGWWALFALAALGVGIFFSSGASGCRA